MDKLDSLYQLYLDNGLLTSKTSIDKFKQSNIQIQESLYNLGKEKGLFATTDLKTFQSAWDEVKKKNLRYGTMPYRGLFRTLHHNLRKNLLLRIKSILIKLYHSEKVVRQPLNLKSL